MARYIPTIGLEIHAELNTASKMFCGCTNNPDEEHPNVNICPVCMAHPGTLPVINKEAVLHVLRVGVAVGGAPATFTEFDRKNYFYPDIPKNYQISQYKYPLISGGAIGPVTITRIHLEEDTARSSHSANTSVVDFNRAGVPLMELVTDPVIHDAEIAVNFARDLRLLLRYLQVGHANLEKGEMRIEANVSMSPRGGLLGTKVEVKNLNSFKAVEQAIQFEIKRQTESLDRGEAVVQETRGWDENKQRTFSQRIKEDSHDYRYFPDPDLPKLQLDEIPQFEAAKLKNKLPELPWKLRERYVIDGLQPSIASVIVGDPAMNTLYKETVAALDDIAAHQLAANYLTSDILGAMSKGEYIGRPLEQLNAREFAVLIKMVKTGEISSRGAKDTLLVWLEQGGNPRDIAKEKGLMQISDPDALTEVINSVLVEHAHVANEYRGGKESALQFLIGQSMKATKGAANPEKLKELLLSELTRS